MRYKCGRRARAGGSRDNNNVGTTAYDELVDLLKSPSARVRRLAAESLERLAWLRVDASVASEALASVVREETDERTRYHVANALQAYQARQESSRRRDDSVSSRPKVSRVRTPL